MTANHGKGPRPRHRLTRQRRVILDALSRVTTHPAADEIYQMVRRELPRISLGTVYRNLEVLSDLGLILTLTMGGNQRRYDGNPVQHYHIRCLGCDKVDDLPAKALPELSAIRGPEGYEVLGHRLEIIALCPKCRSSRDVD